MLPWRSLKLIEAARLTAITGDQAAMGTSQKPGCQW
jgi:hypothetical protein